LAGTILGVGDGN